MVQLLSATLISRHGTLTGSDQKCAKITVFTPHEDPYGV